MIIKNNINNNNHVLPFTFMFTYNRRVTFADMVTLEVRFTFTIDIAAVITCESVLHSELRCTVAVKPKVKVTVTVIFYTYIPEVHNLL